MSDAPWMSGVKGALRAPRSFRRPLTPDIREEISSIGGCNSSSRISEKILSLSPSE
jgi:hypothetical protein